MKIRVLNDIENIDPSITIVCPFFSEDTLNDVPWLREVGGGRVEHVLSGDHVRLELYETFLLPPDGRPGILFVGAENREDVNIFYLRKIYSAASRVLTRKRFNDVAVLDRGIGSAHQFGQAAVEGTLYGAHDEAIRRVKGRHPRKVESLALLSARDGDEIMRGANLGQVVARAVSVARNFVNLPPNELNPTSFADQATAMAEKVGLRPEILDENAIRAKGMGSLLGVAQGSDEPPRIIILRYGDGNAPIKLALVGKGLTFDSGGLSLKTAEGMESMKSDMGGGAAVIAAMSAVAELAPPGISVTGYVGATENMPGGKSMRPGDILKAMTGETIEVLNTDAEGRLVLADVLALAVQEGATHIVDFATLTGGAVVALGHAATLAAGAPAEWVATVVSAAEEGMERAWQMPIYREYRQDMESPVADIKNSGGRWGSALTASAFLQDFVSDVPWAHMDIAGTAWNDRASAYAPEGGTGEGVGTIISLVRRLANRKD